MQQVFVDFYQNWHHLAQAIIILIVTLIVTLVIHFALRGRYKRESNTRHVWGDAALGALSGPLQGVVWMIGLSIAIGPLIAGGHMPVLHKTFPLARDVLVIVFVAWFFMRLVRRGEWNLFARAKEQGKEYDPTAADAIGKLVRAVIVIIALLVMVQSLGFSIASLLAFGGVAGIAIGFAAQGLVANLFGGITIFVSRPFKVGEYIIFPASELMGEVQHIGWRATRVMGFNRKPFYVPNSIFNTQTIINHSRMTSRCIEETMYVRLQDIDKVSAIVDEVQHMLEEHPEVEHEFFAFNFSGYDKHAVKLFLYAFTVGTGYVDFMRIKADLLMKIAASVHEHGAKLAVPVSDVRMPEGLALQHEYEGGRREPASEGAAHSARA